ncbi:protein hedgehog [Favolaschia claudopus]|uniref:Protein hedgehog n=1 Tax=Favolaschia claudopus TaxID=2862362 RepID=A0AAW0CPK5_9AGAR
MHFNPTSPFVLILRGGTLSGKLGKKSRNGIRILDWKEPAAILPKILSWVGNSQEERRKKVREVYSIAAKSVRRSDGQAVILLAGHSGHGKSKTINRLIGQELLMRNTNKILSAEITVAFDDTPGLEDNTFEDRELNASLLRAYKIKHFADIYPNVILLVAAWDSVTPDAHNEPSHFTSAIGKTIYALYRSDLVDEQRANIVVVVTQVLSSFHQFDDYKTDKEKHAQWRIEEGRRKGIITDLQRKMFPRDMTAKYPVLPDGLLSHQNLYEAICATIQRPSSDGSRDLVLTGAEPLSSIAQTSTTILVSGEDLKVKILLQFVVSELVPQILPKRKADPPSSHHSTVMDLANIYLGTTYNHAQGTFGYGNVMEQEKISFHPFGGEENFAPMLSSSHHGDLEDIRLRSYYSTDWAFRAATASSNLECYILHSVTHVVTGLGHLSKPMQQLISRLPAWSTSPEVHSMYTQFFVNYGTHVITQLVLGGTIRAIVDSTSSGKSTAMIFRDGGASVAAQLTVCLERNFPPTQKSKGWTEARNKWTQALEVDPVFCPDHKFTGYQAIYHLDGISAERKADLEHGYKFYMASQPKDDNSSIRKLSRNSHSALQREKNLADAVKSLLDAVTQALYRLWQGR